MHSLSSKITYMVVVAVLISMAFLGLIAILSMKSDGDRGAYQMMSLICKEKCNEVDSYLQTIEDSADAASDYVIETFDAQKLADAGVLGADGLDVSKKIGDEEKQEVLDAYLKKHIAEVDKMFSAIASDDMTVYTYYYRINPQLSSREQGFWYRRGYLTNHFLSEQMTDISRYPADDEAHVGWYYRPLEQGGPTWLDPYVDSHLDKTIVSFIIPIYVKKTFIGHIGIDMMFSSLTGKVESLEILNNGYAFMTNKDGTIMYHPEHDLGTTAKNIGEEQPVIGRGGIEGELVRYTYRNVKKQAVWGTLNNGLKLVICAPVKEVNAGWRSVTANMLFMGLLLLGVFFFVASKASEQITWPLRRLARASRQLADGNYDVELHYDEDDEVGILTEAFSRMAEKLQLLIGNLNRQAYKDALTSVGNKASFDLYAMQMDEEMRKADPADPIEFAIAMFDCNDLKRINDTYGHEKGDVYLRTASQLICRTYDHSPVFRMGGDEFAVILKGADLRNLEKLQEQFEEEQLSINRTAEHPWEHVSIAKGFAYYEPGVDQDLESALRRADENMYEDKKRCKTGRPS